MLLAKTFRALALALAVATPLSVSADSAGEPLIGEVLITEDTVQAYADAFVAEAYRIWSSDGWRLTSNTSGVINEAKAVSGVFASANVDVTRATAVVDLDAQKLFDYLITPEGYRLIDPGSNQEDFYKPPLQQFATNNWREAGNVDKKYLKVDRVEANLPGFRTREFVVLNSMDSISRIFVSKSVQHASDPGCSLYGGESCFNATEVPVRVLNTFAVDVQPVATNASQSVVRLINYADLVAPEVPAVAMNAINAPFLVDMVERFRTAQL